ncbi:MAG: HlyD family efflux transporter periplasmic adaptor subunit [Anaerofustis sp.]
MRKKAKIRLDPKNRNKLIFAAVAILILVYLVIQRIPESTTFLNAEQYNITADAKMYVFKKQEYILLNSTAPLNYLVTEGSDIAASAVIADNYYISTNKYLQQKIAALQYMIDNPKVDTKWEIYLVISELNDQIASIDSQIDAAVANGDDATKASLISQQDALKDQIEVLDIAMRYVFTDLSVMSAMKDTLSAQLNSTTIPLTLDNLNFNVFGYIYFSKDGYEDVLNMDALDDVYDGYFTYLDHFSPNTTLADGQYILKSCATDRIVIAVRVPSDTVLEDKDDIINDKNDLQTAYNMDKEGGYYDFLFRRIDLLNQFPSMTAYASDGTEITGNVVDVVSEGDDLVLMLAVRDNISYFSDKSIFTGTLTADSFRVYSVPKSSIVTVNGSTYITIISDTSVSKKTIPVTVYKYTGGKALLRVGENPDLANGTQILVHGQKPDMTNVTTDTTQEDSQTNDSQ